MREQRELVAAQAHAAQRRQPDLDGLSLLVLTVEADSALDLECYLMQYENRQKIYKKLRILKAISKFLNCINFNLWISITNTFPKS